MKIDSRELKKEYLEKIEVHRDSLERSVSTIEELNNIQGKCAELRGLVGELEKLEGDKSQF